MACLDHLANRGAFGIVHNVYMLAGCSQATREHLSKNEVAFRAASGRIVNCSASDDLVLKGVLGQEHVRRGKGISKEVQQQEYNMRFCKPKEEEKKEEEDPRGRIYDE